MQLSVNLLEVPASKDPKDPRTVNCVAPGPCQVE